MKRILYLLAIIIFLSIPFQGQVKNRIKTRFGWVNQLKDNGYVYYLGMKFWPIGKDSLIVKNDRNKNDSVIIPEILTIDKKPFVVIGFKRAAFESFNGRLKYVSLPSSVSTISESCFYGNSRLTGISMPGVKRIGAYGFFRTGFQSITLPEGLEYIGQYAFNSCDRLRAVSLPSTLQYIDDEAFLHCERLDTVYVNFTKPIEISKGAFWPNQPNELHRKIVLSVPTGCKDAFQSAEGWKFFKKIIEH